MQRSFSVWMSTFGVAFAVTSLCAASGCLRLDVKALQNRTPVAVVDAAQVQVTVGDSVTLVGSGTDPDCVDAASPACVPLTFAWSQVGTSTPVVLENPTSAHAVFTTTTVGQLFFQLTVSDGLATSPPALVEVVVAPNPANHAPVAVATTPSESVAPLTSFVLDGSGSHDDEDGTNLTYHWSVVSPHDATGVILDADNVATTSATLLDKGTYVFALVVTDTQGQESSLSSVAVQASNTPPVPVVETLRSTQNRQEIAVSATASDDDGADALSFRWTLVDFPVGGQVPVVVDPDGKTARVTPSSKTPEQNPALCQSGNHACYVLGLDVSDGQLSTHREVFITSLNNQPVAVGNDGESQSITLKLDARGSHDDDNDALNATWTQTAGPALNGGTVINGVRRFVGAQITTTPVDGAAAADFRFDLVVDDGISSSVPVSVAIHFDGTGHRPVLTLATGVVRALEGEVVFPSVVANAHDDDDGDVVSIVWTRDDSVSSPLFPAQLNGGAPDLIAPSFRALVASGSTTAVYRVTASDGRFTTAEQLVTVVVAPSAVSQPGFWVSSGENAVDDATCGTSLHPCRTLQFLTGTRLPTVPLALRAGESVFLTTGTFTLEGGAVQLVWPSDLSLVGGFDPVTLVQTGVASTFVLPASDTATPGVSVTSSGSSPIAFAHITLVANTTRAGPEPVLDCDNCTLNLVDVGVQLTTATTAGHHGVIVHGPSAHLVAGSDDDDGLHVSDSGDATAGATQAVHVGVLASNGATVDLERSRIDLLGINSVASGALVVNNATVHVSRSRLAYSGQPLDIDIGTVVALGSASVTLESSLVVLHAAGVPGKIDIVSAVYANDVSRVAVRNCTLDGPGFNRGVRAKARVDIVNTLFRNFGVAILLDDNSNGPTSTSALTNNGFDLATSGAVLACASAFVGTGTDLATTSCNHSGVSWAGNDILHCALVDASGGDFHLAGPNNVCADAGAIAAPGGDPPTSDLDGVSFVTAPPVGCFEAR
jgi:hypothetical protein